MNLKVKNLLPIQILNKQKLFKPVMVKHEHYFECFYYMRSIQNQKLKSATQRLLNNSTTAGLIKIKKPKNNALLTI